MHKRIFKLMGCRSEICLVGDNFHWVDECMLYIIAEMVKVERLLSTFDETSQTNRINENAGLRPVQVDKEIFDLIEYSIEISELTNGAFDITYGSLNRKFWNFDKNMTVLPNGDDYIDMPGFCNFRNIELDKHERTIFLRKKGMRLGFGGIAKGYVADLAEALLRKEGVENGMMNASGDIKAWGTAPGKDHWTIGLRDPKNAKKSILNLKIRDKAVATSGNYEKFVIIDKKYYSHTINPGTGFPVEGLKTITVITPTAIFADALATAVGVLGTDSGIKLINRLKGVQCFIIDNNDQFHFSNDFNN